MKVYHYRHEDMDDRKYRCFFYKTDRYQLDELPKVIFDELGHRVTEIWLHEEVAE